MEHNEVWPSCGHPRTSANTISNGHSGKCRACNRVTASNWREKKRAEFSRLQGENRELRQLLTIALKGRAA